MTDVKEPTEVQVERKRMDAIWWAGALIWIGLALAAEYLEILPEVWEDNEWWPWIFIGLAPWSIALNLYQFSSDRLPNPNAWDWIWTIIFSAVALGVFVDVGGELVAAVVLIGAGIVLLVRAMASANREPGSPS